jgi:hypothetical protein
MTNTEYMLYLREDWILEGPRSSSFWPSIWIGKRNGDALLVKTSESSYTLEASLPRLTEFVQMADLLLHKILAANCFLFSYDCTEKTSESRCFFFLISFISPEVKTNHFLVQTE